MDASLIRGESFRFCSRPLLSPTDVAASSSAALTERLSPTIRLSRSVRWPGSQARRARACPEVISPLIVWIIIRFLSSSNVVGIPDQLNWDKTISDSCSSKILSYVTLYFEMNSIPLESESSTRMPITVMSFSWETFIRSSTSFWQGMHQLAQRFKTI